MFFSLDDGFCSYNVIDSKLWETSVRVFFDMINQNM
jgi:hypothetical protein